jgi:hypothetical protein
LVLRCRIADNSSPFQYLDKIVGDSAARNQGRARLFDQHLDVASHCNRDRKTLCKGHRRPLREKRKRMRTTDQTITAVPVGRNACVSSRTFSGWSVFVLPEQIRAIVVYLRLSHRLLTAVVKIVGERARIQHEHSTNLEPGDVERAVAYRARFVVGNLDERVWH